MNLNILAFVFKNEVHCKMCNSGLDMQVLKDKSGLAITFVLKCFACPYRVEFSSSNFHEGTQIATLSLHNARYITYLGDGDCKAFDAVKKKNIYGNGYPTEKLECIGHVMKRMGTRLRRLKVQLKGQILSDGV
ncbi:uncharacterized protein TNCV_1797181 [Trichonephila clavipes]|nr:uncharacterized protein TNCV_1797181 [Trichonephila clavipes]